MSNSPGNGQVTAREPRESGRGCKREPFSERHANAMPGAADQQTLSDGQMGHSDTFLRERGLQQPNSPVRRLLRLLLLQQFELELTSRHNQHKVVSKY